MLAIMQCLHNVIRTGTDVASLWHWTLFWFCCGGLASNGRHMIGCDNLAALMCFTTHPLSTGGGVTCWAWLCKCSLCSGEAVGMGTSGIYVSEFSHKGKVLGQLDCLCFCWYQGYLEWYVVALFCVYVVLWSARWLPQRAQWMDCHPSRKSQSDFWAACGLLFFIFPCMYVHVSFVSGARFVHSFQSLMFQSIPQLCEKCTFLGWDTASLCVNFMLLYHTWA